MSLPESSVITAEEDPYHANLRLNRTEFALRRTCLTSMPRYLSIVLGTRCNINCPYCYQAKTGEDLLAPEYFGDHLRRELAAFYPYLSTLRIQGGEVFMIPGFEQLVAEVSAAVSRPIVSISTNGTLINQAWAEKIVGIPFQGITVSIDGATPETYARLRRGASLNEVLTNVRRIQNLKIQHRSNLPDLDFFFLVMRSNYREILPFLSLARDYGIERVSFQMLLVDQRNLSREPGLVDEVSFEPEEVLELQDLIRNAIKGQRGEFKSINLSGFHSLFESHNLETDFLDEGRFSIYPDHEGSGSDAAGKNGCNPDESAVEAGTSPDRIEAPSPIGNTVPLCPNPWTLMYVTETGDVHVCFMATPIGNVYETPLARLWNSPKAIAARNDMINGCYEAAGCSRLWCSWREGRKSDRPSHAAIHELAQEFTSLTQRALRSPVPLSEMSDSTGLLASVRRMLTERNRRIAELEGNFVGLCEKNRVMLEAADKQNQALAARAAELEHAMHSTWGEKVHLASDARFNSGLLAKFVRKSAIGGAIRSIQALDWASNVLRRFVNRLCTR